MIQTYAGEERTVLSIGFDDGNATVYDNGIAAMQGLPAYVAITTANVGGPKSMTWEQVSCLDALGWEIMSHSTSDVRYGDMTIEQAKQAMIGSKQAIESNLSDYDVKGFIWPGIVGPESMWSLAWEHYDYAGSIWDIDMNRWSFDQYSKNPEYQRMRLFTYLHAAVYGYLGYLNLYSHAVTESACDAAVIPANLADFTSRLIENDSVVMNPRDYYEQYRNAVTASIVGDQSAFEIRYDQSYCNYTHDNVLVELRNMPIGKYVIVRDGEMCDAITVSCTERALISLGAGSYKIMSPDDYRQSHIDSVMSPLYTLIPLVIIAIIGAILIIISRLNL